MLGIFKTKLNTVIYVMHYHINNFFYKKMRVSINGLIGEGGASKKSPKNAIKLTKS